MFPSLKLPNNSQPRFMDANSDTSPASRKIHADDSSTSSSADGSGEFRTASSHTGTFFLADQDSDGIILQLVSDLDSADIHDQKRAATELRLIAKNKPDERIKIVRAGAVQPLISLISSPDPQLQEYGVSAVFNLSLCDASKDEIARAEAVKPLVAALGGGTSTTRENAASALLRLSEAEKGDKAEIGRSGAIPALVNLLVSGSFRGKKDACTALYSLCSVNENKVRAVQAGVMKPLVELMADSESKMVDKSAFVLNLLVLVAEARAALVKEDGVPVLVEALETGTPLQKEVAAAILLQLCEDPSGAYHNTVVGEGAIPPLVELAQTGTRGARHKAGSLLKVLRRRQPQPDTCSYFGRPRNSLEITGIE